MQEAGEPVVLRPPVEHFQHVDNDVSITYLQMLEDGGVSMEEKNREKLSILYRRVKKYAPWLLKKKSSMASVRLRQRHLWLVTMIGYVFAIDLNNVGALCLFMCGFLYYLGTTFISSLLPMLGDGMVRINIIYYENNQLSYQYLHEIRLDTLKTMSVTLCDPLLGVLLVSLLNLSWAQYEMLIHILRKGWNPATKQFEALSLSWPALGAYAKIVIPRMVAPFREVKRMWKSIFQQQTNYTPINIPNVAAKEWLITDIIEYVCGNAFLRSLFVIPVETLEIILKVPKSLKRVDIDCVY